MLLFGYVGILSMYTNLPADKRNGIGTYKVSTAGIEHNWLPTAMEIWRFTNSSRLDC